MVPEGVSHFHLKIFDGSHRACVCVCVLPEASCVSLCCSIKGSDMLQEVNSGSELCDCSHTLNKSLTAASLHESNTTDYAKHLLTEH